jgi:predicted GH43/DUF377 family glycosyl hydrolase
LLDLHDPSRIISQLKEPLLRPEGNEREGYVPNVVYSCGSLVYNGQLILPYGVSDRASSIARIEPLPKDTVAQTLRAVINSFP